MVEAVHHYHVPVRSQAPCLCGIGAQDRKAAPSLMLMTVVFCGSELGDKLFSRCQFQEVSFVPSFKFAGEFHREIDPGIKLLGGLFGLTAAFID